LFAAQAQVNLQTGAAEQSFPLINYADSKSGLSLNVALNYSSGNGLLVNEFASNVGTGWNLSVGGCITRVQQGAPDDQDAYQTSNENNLGSFTWGYLYNPYYGQGCNIGRYWYTMFDRHGDFVYKEHNIVTADLEQDKFVYAFNGRTGSFVISRDWKIKTLGDSRLKFAVFTSNMRSQGIRTTIERFEVTTEDGIKYVFREKGVTTVCRYRLYKGEGSGNIGNGVGADRVNYFEGVALPSSEYPFVVNNWYLSEMENTNNGEKITFNYTDVKTNFVSGKVVSRSFSLGSGKKKNYEKGKKWLARFAADPDLARDICYDLNQLNAFAPKGTNVTFVRTIQTNKRLVSVDLPGNNTINLVYPHFRRIDLPSENPLQRIAYYSNGILVRGYNFRWGYFYQDKVIQARTPGGLNPKWFRLCLLSVQKTGNNSDEASEPAYQFSYYTGSLATGGIFGLNKDNIVPPMNSLSTDHWGYYNGNYSGLSTIKDHDALDAYSYMRAALPAYKSPKDGYAKNGLLKTITYPTGGTLTYEYSQIKTNYWDNAFITTARSTGGVSVSSVTMYDGEDHAKDIIKTFQYVDANGKSSHWGDETGTYHDYSDIDMTFGNHLRNQYPNRGVEEPELAVNVDWNKIKMQAIGVGVAVTLAQAAIAIFVAPVVGQIVGAVLFVMSTVMAMIEDNKEPQYIQLHISNRNMILSNPLPRLYSRVEVTENVPGGNGKSIYEFTDFRDYALIRPRFQWPFVPEERYHSWAYGLLKKVTLKDKNGNTVQENSNTYEIKNSKLATSTDVNCQCKTHKKESLNESSWRAKDFTSFTWNTYQFMVPQIYFNNTGITNLKLTEEKKYNSTGNYSNNIVNIANDPATLLQKGTLVSVDEDKLIMTVTYYPTDYDLTGALQTLKQRNAIHVPVATEVWSVKYKGLALFDWELLRSNITEYAEYTFSNGTSSYTAVKPWKTYELAQKLPVPVSSIGFHSRTSLIRNSSLFRLTSEMTYDTKGNLIKTVKDSDKEGYFYDHDDRYLVATVLNADQTDAAYTNFEGGGKGNWTYSTGGIVFDKAFMGKYSFRMYPWDTDPIKRTGLNTGTTYVVTYWVTNEIEGEPASITVNGQAGTTLYTSGVWSLKMNEVSGVSEVDLNGDGYIEELRLHPKDALMSSVTYSPGIGKVAEADANNRVIFYEYDALGRLKFIRNQDKHIIKAYEYNYKK